MKKSIATLFLLCFSVLLFAQNESKIINMNPDPNGEPWWAGGSSEEEWDGLKEFPVTEAYLKSATVLPSQVDISTTKYFRPIFNQSYGSCSQASSVGYGFNYEINFARNTDARFPQNRVSPQFTYNFLSDAEGGGTLVNNAYDILRDNGAPSEQDYGGFNPYKKTGWVSGYDTYFKGMDNRVTDYFNITVTTAAGIEQLKGWLHNHLSNDPRGGGIAHYYANVSEGMKKVRIPSGQHEAGKFVITTFGTSGGHAMTICGYDDEVAYDFNDDGKLTNDIDITGDGIVDLRDWEIGAWKMVNSWGSNWGDNGFSYLPYALCFSKSNLGFNRNGVNQKVMVCKVAAHTKPRLTMRVKMNTSYRKYVEVKAGIAKGADATTPEHLITLALPKKGKMGELDMTEGNPFITEPYIEFGYDISKLEKYITDKSPVTFFFQLISSNGKVAGEIKEVSIFSYQINPAGEEFVSDVNSKTFSGSTTVTIPITFVPYDLKAPQNVAVLKVNNQYQINWTDPQISNYPVAGYSIYVNGDSVSSVVGKENTFKIVDFALNENDTVQVAANYEINSTLAIGEKSAFVIVKTQAQGTNAPIAQFSIDGNGIIKQYESVSFLNSSSNEAVECLWYFDGGTPETSNATNPKISYNEQGMFNVALVVKNKNGKDSLFKQSIITVNQPDPIVANFRVNAQKVISGKSVQFTDITEQEVQKRTWQFEGGFPATASSKSVNVQYKVPGVYKVTLYIEKGMLHDEIVRENYITVTIVPPSVQFTMNKDELDAPDTICFTNMTSNYVESFHWIFEGSDTKTSTDENPCVFFNKPGTHAITLIATNEAGADTITKYISVAWQDAGNALAFDGKNEYAKVKTPFPINGISSYTVEFWLNPETNIGENQTIGSMSGTFLFSLFENGGVRAGIDYANSVVVDSNAVRIGVYQHFAFVFGGSKIKLYINGLLVGETNVAAKIKKWSDFLIGKVGTGNINGMLDEFRIWSSARTQAEIVEFMNKPIKNPENMDDLVLYYDFDQNESAEISDRKGTNHAQRVGYATVGDAWVKSGAFVASIDKYKPQSVIACGCQNYFTKTPYTFTSVGSENIDSVKWYVNKQALPQNKSELDISFEELGTCEISLITYNAFGSDTASLTITVNTDSEAPTGIENLNMVEENGSYFVKWNTSSDNSTKLQYVILLDGKELTVTSDTIVSISVPDVGESCEISVYARDYSGNQSNSITQRFWMPLAVDDASLSQIKLVVSQHYNTVSLSINHLVSDADLAVYSTTGSCLYMGTIKIGQKIRLTLNSGVYVVRYGVANQSCVQKIVIQ